jgi:DeoR/GlpR family transcriptional regulator of sugar metabolism
VTWCERQRQLWIAEMVTIYGFINREHLQRKFGISVPQASKDLQTFARQQQHTIHYDLSRKCYVATQRAQRDE